MIKKISTEKKAAEILVNKGIGFVIPTAKQKKILAQVFVGHDYIIYGKAFDIIKVSKPIDLDNYQNVEDNIEDIVLYEIKSTNRENINNYFDKYFFGLTTAELLVAQNLKSKYKFIFININTEEYLELTLREVFAKAKGIYPTWSIQF